MQRIIGVFVGGLITLALLWIMSPTGPDANQKYLTAVVIGGIANILWPWVIGLYLARRLKARRANETSAEIDKRIAEERAKGV